MNKGLSKPEKLLLELQTLKDADLSIVPDGGLLIKRRIEKIEIELSVVDKNNRKRSAEKDNDKMETVKNISKLPKLDDEQPQCSANLKGLYDWLQTLKAIEPHPNPKGLTVQLLQHQKEGLPWMIQRENGFPKGGILADDMGLGKTLSIIALILQQKHNRKSNDEIKRRMISQWKGICKGKDKVISAFSTLIITPASVIYQWENELKKRLEAKTLRVYVYHGANRIRDPNKLVKYDVVLTTYNIISSEIADKEDEPCLMKIAWERIILDEAHNIRNRKSKMSAGCCQLMSLRRWAVTGTPIHNSLWDLYSLVKFLHLPQLSVEKTWKRFVEDNASLKSDFEILVHAILLRRMKNQISSITKKPLITLKERTFDLVEIVFGELEKKCYDSMFEKAREYVKNLMNTEKQTSNFNVTAGSDRDVMRCCLVLLLRLRQACVHFALTQNALEKDETLQDNCTEAETTVTSPKELLSIDRGFMQSQNADGNNESFKVFEISFVSAKLELLLERLFKVIEDGDKCVIVSQWTTMLDIIEHHLKMKKYKVTSITGKVATKDRQTCIDSFNNKDKGAQIMLLSLSAGGTGLNLVGGNHLFLMDLPWNPALEKQAFDRIYRIGQEKNVFIHKFYCKKTIEEQVLALQEKKTKLSDAVLDGKFAGSSALNLNDMKFLLGLDKTRK